MYPQANEALNERIYLVVAQIPSGRVATYGDIATIVGGGIDARTVGYALNDLPKARSQTIPWQRVINREGGISTRGLLQRQILESEGIEFDTRDRVIMARFHWDGPSPEWIAAHGFTPLPPRDEGDRSEQLSLF
jgi:methylated-DNA-protein-cysteine methyltransferase-like protein